MQKILTKYWLMLHVTALTIAVAFTTSITDSWLVNGVFWLGLMTLQCAVVVPALRRGESLSDARARWLRGVSRDSFFYISLGLVVFSLMQLVNSDSKMTYFPESDLWHFSKPLYTWLPSSVDKGASLLSLAFFTAILIGVTVLRHAVGRDSKRVMLQIMACTSGLLALISLWGVLQGSEGSLVASYQPGALNYGSLYGVWMIVSFGVVADKLGRRESGIVLIYALAFIGNIVGVLYFTTTLSIVLYLLVALVLFAYWLLYLRSTASKSITLRLVLMTLLVFALVGCSVVGVFRNHPGAVKIGKIMDSESSYFGDLLEEKGVRSAAALDIWREKPWFGVGANGFHHYLGTVVPESRWRLLKQDHTSVRNDVLQLLCEYGVVGISLLAAMILSLIVPLLYRLRVAWKRHKDPAEHTTRSYFFWLSPITVTGIVAVIVLLCESFYSSPMNSPSTFISWIVILSVLPAFLPAPKAGDS